MIIAIGIIAAYQVLVTRAEKRQLNPSHISSITLWGVLGGFLGAKLLYWITQGKNIMAHPEMLWDIASGFVVYGGILGGILTAKRKRTDGFIASLYLLLYSLGRFIIEFYRGDIIRGSVGILSTSQFISLLLIIGTCLIMLVKSYQTLRHRNA
ncbi:prolipoprotein diacylglyceryl transferase [Paenibacillus thiaminolyticus]|nr:prolipoprotein diacylglyceryl transferase family protein [Paenibacillus thiaminolyticus]WCF06203.1 prolipoprotein diacylglyceryl transferase [Paenibacillus thiaminolyticus]